MGSGEREIAWPSMLGRKAKAWLADVWLRFLHKKMISSSAGWMISHHPKVSCGWIGRSDPRCGGSECVKP